MLLLYAIVLCHCFVMDFYFAIILLASNIQKKTGAVGATSASQDLDRSSFYFYLGLQSDKT